MLIEASQRSLKPLTGMNIPQWLSSMIFNTATESGERVTPDTAISLSTFFNAVKLLGETIGQIPVGVYKVTVEDGCTKKRLYTAHPAHQLVALRPNSYMHAFTFNRVMMNHVLRFDNAFALIERDGFGRPLSMIPIHPDRVTIKITEDQEVFYEIDGQYLISSTHMIHLMDYTEDGIIGKSKVSILRQELGNAIATNKFIGAFFGKGVNVSGFLKTKGYLADQEAIKRLKTSFVKQVVNSAFGVGVLENDMDWIKNEVNPVEAQLGENRKLNAQVVAQILNVPLPFLKVLEDAKYSNMEQLDIQFSKYTITPWLVNWEQEYTLKLFSKEERKRGNLIFMHDMNALMRGDMVSRGKFYESMTKTGAYSPNNVLEDENKDTFKGGNVHVIGPGYQILEQMTAGENNG